MTQLLYNRSNVVINRSQCLWLEEPMNRGYDENIKNLKIIQKWIKKMLLSKRLMRLIRRLMPLYYAPDAKGGYFHKREMLVFFDIL